MIFLKRLSSEFVIFILGLGMAFIVWVTASIYSTQAKADRVIAVEEKVDYIYKYIIEKK